MMSRWSVSQSCVVQFQAIAPGMCPWSYPPVSTSTSTTRTFGSLRCATTQAVSTSTSGSAYWLMTVLPLGFHGHRCVDVSFGSGFARNLILAAEFIPQGRVADQDDVVLAAAC